MGVRQKSGRGWVAEVYVGVGPDGRKEYLSRSAATKKEALSLWAEMNAEVSQGKRKATPQHTLAALLDEWLATADLSPTTAYGYRRVVDVRLKPAMGKLRLRQITPQRLDAYYKGLRDEGLKPLTVRNVHAILRSALAQGVRWGWLSSNPALLASPGRVGATEVKVPPLDDVITLLAHAEESDPDLHAVVFLTAATGARRSEVCGLRWSDVDLDTGTVVIRRAVVDVGGRSVVKSTKTTATRRVSVDATTVALLRALKLRQAERLLACGARLSDDAYVYAVNVEGSTPMLPATFSGRFDRLCKAAGVRINLHGLRHLAATLLVAGGHDIRTVAARLGHSDPSLTLKVYAHALTARDVAAGDALGGLLRASETA